MSDFEHGIIFGKDGWLFLGKGSNDFMSYMTGEKELTAQVIEYWGTILHNRKKWFENAGIKYLHVFVPEKVTIYSEFIEESINLNQGHIARLNHIYPDLFLNVVPYFTRIKNDYLLYDKTDTHWNYNGAGSCYQLICSILQYEFNAELFTGEKLSINSVCDLGSKLSPPRRETIVSLKRDPNYSRYFSNLLVRYKEKYKIENEIGLHVGSRVIFRNEYARYQEKVIIFGDSFSEYRRSRLTEMFAETFLEVHFCWSANIDYDYVRRVQPDIVISELAERFAVNVPNDIFKVDAFARTRLKAYLLERKNSSANKLLVKEKNTIDISKKINDDIWKKPCVLPATGKRGPDYLIIGSMKCGTTILNDYINLHPDTFSAKQKEIHYFSLNYNKGEKWYADFFVNVPNNKMTGEASPTYFDMTQDDTLPLLIQSTLPNAKLIVILKNPIDRAISHFFHFRNVNKIAAFQSIDPSELFSGDLLYKYHHEFTSNIELNHFRFILDFGNYFERLTIYKRIFGDNLLIINNDDLWRDGKNVMNNVFKYLGLSHYESTMFEQKKYVTPKYLKQISNDAIQNLTNYYQPDLDCLRKVLGIAFTDIL